MSQDTRVFLTTENNRPTSVGMLHGLYNETGTLAWSSPPLPFPSHPLAVEDDCCITTQGDGSYAIVLFNLADGTVLWKKQVSSPCLPAAMDAQAVYLIATHDEAGTEVFAHDRTTGESLWSITVPGRVPARSVHWNFFEPARVCGSLLLLAVVSDAVSQDVTLMAIARATGHIAWQCPCASPHVSLPVQGSGQHLFVTERPAGDALHHGSSLVAMSSSDGTIAWRSPIAGDIQLTSPIIQQDVVYVSSSQEQSRGTLTALSINTGSVVWNMPIPPHSAAPVIGSDASLYLSSWDDPDYAITKIAQHTGQILWQRSLRVRPVRPIESASLIFVGTVALSPNTRFNGLCVALESLSGEMRWSNLPLPVGPRGVGKVVSGPSIYFETHPLILAAEHLVVCPKPGGSINAYSAEQGDLVWSRALTGVLRWYEMP